MAVWYEQRRNSGGEGAVVYAEMDRRRKRISGIHSGLSGTAAFTGTDRYAGTGAEWFRFYAVKRGHHPNARDGFTTTSNLAMMNFKLLDYIDEISPRPLLFVVGDRAHSRFFSDNAYAAAREPKEMYVVGDAEHIDLYNRRDRIPFDKMADFFHTRM